MKRKAVLFTAGLFALTLFVQGQRVVLIEQFTNSGCPPCASSSPPVFSFVDNNQTNVVAIAYHTSFPYSDSMYFENPTESNARVNYYGVIGVPYSVVDGNYYANASVSFIPVMSNTVNARKAVPERYSIKPVNLIISGNVLSTKIVFESLDAGNLGDSLRAQVVVIENNVLKSSYAASPGANAETEYKYVMRKMLPNQNGNFLKNRNLGGKDTLSLSWPMQKIKNSSEIRVVAFVQNKNTKEVYMSQLYREGMNLDVAEKVKEGDFFEVYPNPVSGDLVVSVTGLNYPASMMITDVFGKQFLSIDLSENGLSKINVSSLPKGIYFVSYRNGDKFLTKKVVKE